jgi:hypothetical protein
MLIYRSNNDLRLSTERTLIADYNAGIAVKVNAVYYYDIENDEEHLLWEKK